MATVSVDASPGLFTVGSKITDPLLSEEAYHRWYEQRHIPDALKTNGISEAHRWRTVDGRDEWPYLAVFPMRDIAFAGSDEFRTIPIEDAQLPGSGRIFDFVDFDTRCYKSVQLFEREKSTSAAAATFMVFVGFTPADEADCDCWYEEEHLPAVSKIPTWMRSERYKLASAMAIRRPTEEPDPQVSSHLTIHYFRGEQCPAEDFAEAGETERSKKIMLAMKESRIRWYRKLSSFAK